MTSRGSDGESVSRRPFNRAVVVVLGALCCIAAAWAVPRVLAMGHARVTRWRLAATLSTIAPDVSEPRRGPKRLATFVVLGERDCATVLDILPMFRRDSFSRLTDLRAVYVQGADTTLRRVRDAIAEMDLHTVVMPLEPSLARSVAMLDPPPTPFVLVVNGRRRSVLVEPFPLFPSEQRRLLASLKQWGS